jgi:hypothetical protein
MDLPTICFYAISRAFLFCHKFKSPQSIKKIKKGKSIRNYEVSVKEVLKAGYFFYHATWILKVLNHPFPP